MTPAVPITLAPQVKICGLTDPVAAATCARLGADAIGLVFHPPSPRHVDLDLALRIADALPEGVPAVGVFVDPEWDRLAHTVTRCRLGVVQLHGNESQSLIDRLQRTFHVQVIKALFAAKPPRMADAGGYRVSAYLVECGRGVQPGGNALAWEWSAAAPLVDKHPTVLAGGLDSDNVQRAIAEALPDAVDVSSGVEYAPGCKDIRKVGRFISAVRRTAHQYAVTGRVPRVLFRTVPRGRQK